MEVTMTKGIEEVDPRLSAMRMALRAVVDALTDKGLVGRSDIINRLREREQHMGDVAGSADLIDQLRDLRKFLE
jgi:hypothetical protein